MAERINKHLMGFCACSVFGILMHAVSYDFCVCISSLDIFRVLPEN